MTKVDFREKLLGKDFIFKMQVKNLKMHIKYSSRPPRKDLTSWNKNTKYLED